MHNQSQISQIEVLRFAHNVFCMFCSSLPQSRVCAFLYWVMPQLFTCLSLIIHLYVLYAVCLFFCAVSPTNISQYNLPVGGGSGSGSGMSRSNSIPAQDSFDLYGEGHPLGGSANSLEERPRAISRSGSFRDSTDEGEQKKTKSHRLTTNTLLRSRRQIFSVLIAYLIDC